MMDEQSAEVSMDTNQVQLPPIFEHLISEISKDRKKLMRDKAFTDPVQLRTYIGQFLFPRLIETIRLLAGVSIEAYGLAASNTNELRRLHYFSVEEFRRLGADLDDEDAQLPGVSPEVLDQFQHAFYALGSLLQAKYPDDKETEAAYNNVAGCLSQLVSDLMNGYDYEDDDDDNDDDNDDDSGDDIEPDDLPPDVSADLEPAAKGADGGDSDETDHEEVDGERK